MTDIAVRMTRVLDGGCGRRELRVAGARGRQKAKGKRQKAKVPAPPFTFCLLPFAFLSSTTPAFVLEHRAMSYKVFLWDNLSAIEWSQVWRLAGQTEVDVHECEIEQVREVLLRELPRDGLAIDAGCGDGKWPVFLTRRGYRVIALDIAHEGVRRARVAEPGLMALQGDVRRTPLRDGAVDAVISLGVVEHDEAGPRAALAEARRILKPGGTLVLAVPFNNLWRRCIGNHVMSWVTRRRRADGHSLGFNEYRFSQRELRAYLREAGFEPLAAYRTTSSRRTTWACGSIGTTRCSTRCAPTPARCSISPASSEDRQLRAAARAVAHQRRGGVRLPRRLRRTDFESAEDCGRAARAPRRANSTLRAA